MRKEFTLSTDRPELVKFRNSNLSLEPKLSEYMILEFSTLESTVIEHTLFVYLKDGDKVIECLQVRVHYI